MRKARPIKDRLLSNVAIDARSGCWNWTGTNRGRGYGQLRVGKATRSAHRLSYEVFCDIIPTGMVVCHRCDNPSCINPVHLFLGTQASNIADMVSKGRNAKGPVVAHAGTKNPKAKLTEHAVTAIRESTGASNKALARKFGVSNVQIANIRKGKSWAHLLVSSQTEGNLYG